MSSRRRIRRCTGWSRLGINAFNFIGAKADIVTHKKHRTLKLHNIVKDSLLEKENILYNDGDMWF